jgi:rSAM/selenodomain-associated transferase 2
MLSIIIPTLNEADQIVEALEAARAAVPGAEIIVADGGSSDATVALATPYAQAVAARRGRARQMNAGAAVASGATLVFLHADTRLPANAGTLIEQTLQDPLLVGGGFAMGVREAGPLYHAMAVITTWRSRCRRRVTGDQALFVRTGVFRQLGGFADIPLMEDVEFGHRLREQGRFRVLNQAVLISTRRHQRHGVAQVAVTGWGYQILYKFGFPPFALHRLYYGKMPE